MNLMQASNQWANRPDDERFWPEDFRAAAVAKKFSAAQAKLPFEALKVISDGGNLLLAGKGGSAASLTHYSFGQLARWASAPAEYIRSLPANLAADCLNHGLRERATQTDNDAKALFVKNGDSLTLRALTSDVYDRVWDVDLWDRMIAPLLSEGWKVPPARPVRHGQKGTRLATASDILANQDQMGGLNINVGDEIAPAGLYMSDRDMFALVCCPEDPLEVNGQVFKRGVIIQNSEVGARSLDFMFFLYQAICGNHIIWGAEDIVSVQVRHRAGRNAQDIGASLNRAMDRYSVTLKAYADSSATGTVNAIKAAQTKEIAANKEDVIDACYKYAKVHGLNLLSRARLGEGYETADNHASWYGSPRTVFGMVSGLTEASQLSAYTDVRTEVDAQASKLLAMAN